MRDKDKKYYFFKYSFTRILLLELLKKTLVTLLIPIYPISQQHVTTYGCLNLSNTHQEL